MFIMCHSRAKGETRLRMAKHRLDQDPERLRLGSAPLAYKPDDTVPAELQFSVVTKFCSLIFQPKCFLFYSSTQ